MNDLGKITITKNKDCENNTYYTAYMKGVDNALGGGDTRNEAKNELLENIVDYIDYLEAEYKAKDQQIHELQKMLNNETNRTINVCVDYIKLKNYEYQVQSYKKMWEELKRFVKSNKPLIGKTVIYLPDTILDKMQELEKSVEADNGNND